MFSIPKPHHLECRRAYVERLAVKCECSLRSETFDHPGFYHTEECPISEVDNTYYNRKVRLYAQHPVRKEPNTPTRWTLRMVLEAIRDQRLGLDGIDGAEARIQGFLRSQ